MEVNGEDLTCISARLYSLGALHSILVCAIASSLSCRDNDEFKLISRACIVTDSNLVTRQLYEFQFGTRMFSRFVPCVLHASSLIFSSN
jgi:hypothetical protein